MSPCKGITWLASYPKSGNTWFRIVLTHVLLPNANLDSINNMDAVLGSPMLVNRSWINKVLGFESSLLRDDELDALRPELYRWYAKQQQSPLYIKLHDAFLYLNKETALFPHDICRAVIYFIRNPLDVAISFAYHTKLPIDWCIDMMANPNAAIPLANARTRQIRQTLFSWSDHVQSWLHRSSLPVCTLRYEDMLQKPLDTFRKAFHFLQLPISDARLQCILEQTAFHHLQAHEKKIGFKETLFADQLFFRKGCMNEWQQVLSPQQIKRIIDKHGDIMYQHAYLNAEGHPVTDEGA